MSKRYKAFGVSVVAFLLLGLMGARIASAQSFHSGDSVSLAQGSVIDSSVYAAGKTVNIDSEVYGDVFCAGQHVTVSGTVHGDVICAGQTVLVTGTVEGDVRLAGQTVTVNGQVTGNATVAGQTFVLGSGAEIDGDLTAGSNSTVVNGTVGRDIVSGSEEMTVAGEVGRNVVSAATTARLASTATVGGDFRLTSAKELDRASGSKVEGKVTRTDPPKHEKASKASSFASKLGWFAYCLMAFVLLSVVLALVAPSAVHAATGRTVKSVWRPLLIGVMALIVAPVLIIATAVSIIGLPIAALAWLLWMVVLLLSGPFFAYYVGRMILRGSDKPLAIMLVGSAVLVTASFVPFIGFIAFLLAITIGTGTVLDATFKRIPKPSYRIKG